MARLPRVTATQVICILLKQRYYLDPQQGTRWFYLNVQERRVAVPYHAGKR